MTHQQDGPFTAPTRARAAFGLLIIALGSMLGPLDAAVNVAFPVITDAFALRTSDIQWIVIVYVLAQSCMSVVFGKMGDLYGHRRVFMYGAGIAAVVHLLAGFAPTYGWLVMFRLLQGLAIGVAMSCGPALATFLFPPSQKRMALGIYTMLFAIGLAVGPLIGGALIEMFGWPSVFWYRAPLALFACAFALTLPVRHVEPLHKVKFDLAGALFLILSLASFVAFTSIARRAGDFPLLAVVLFLTWIALTWAFVKIEKNAEEPVVKVDYYRNPIFAGIQFSALAIAFFGFTVFLLVPYLTLARGDLNLFEAGVTLALYPVGTICAGFLGARFSRRVSSMTLVKSGLMIAAVGLLLTSFVTHGTHVVWLAAALAITGFGLGTFQVGNLDVTTSILPEGDRGVAGSLVNVARLLGIVIGAALISWLYDALGGEEAGMAAFRDTFLIMGVLLVILTVTLSLTTFRKAR